MNEFPLDIGAWKRTQPQFEMVNDRFVEGLPFERTYIERRVHKNAFKVSLAKKYIGSENPLHEPWWSDWFLLLDRCISPVDHRHEYDQMNEVAMILGHFRWTFIYCKKEK